MRGELWAVDLGMIPYAEALALQHRLVAAKKTGALEAELLLLLEHPPVITLGRRGDEGNVLAPPELLAARGIEVHRVERGGDVTYHGPGQLVGYPIVSLRHLPNRKDVGRFVWTLQEAIIRTVAHADISAERIEKVIGVWVRAPAPSLDGLGLPGDEHAALSKLVAAHADRKIAAIGARVEGWVSFHGFALNVSTDLSDFALIVPCGLEDERYLDRARGRARPPYGCREAHARHQLAACGLRPALAGAGAPRSLAVSGSVRDEGPALEGPGVLETQVGERSILSSVSGGRHARQLTQPIS